MRILVPKQVLRWQDYQDIDGRHLTVGPIGDYATDTFKSEFYGEQHQPIGDCLHAKLRANERELKGQLSDGIVGNGVLVNGRLYVANGQFTTASKREVIYVRTYPVIVDGDEYIYHLRICVTYNSSRGRVITTPLGTHYRDVDATVYYEVAQCTTRDRRWQNYRYKAGSYALACSEYSTYGDMSHWVINTVGDPRFKEYLFVDDWGGDGFFKDFAEAGNLAMGSILRFLSLVTHHAEMPAVFSTAGYRLNQSDPYVLAEFIPPHTDELFFLGEREIVRHSPSYLNKPMVAYWREWLIEHAYADALQSVPTLNDNSIQNLGEIVGFIYALVVKRRIEIPKSLQDAWLAYRYTVGTGVLDAEEAIAFVDRHLAKEWLNTIGLKCYGQASTTIEGKTVTCRVVFKIKSQDCGNLAKIWDGLTTYGLAPDFYQIWDSIPYSFMVDWFVPIGDALSTADLGTKYMGDTYRIFNVCFSLKYNLQDTDYYPWSCYSRWESPPLASLNGLYWFEKPEASARTKFFRFLDAASILVR